MNYVCYWICYYELLDLCVASKSGYLSVVVHEVSSNSELSFLSLKGWYVLFVICDYVLFLLVIKISKGKIERKSPKNPATKYLLNGAISAQL